MASSSNLHLQALAVGVASQPHDPLASTTMQSQGPSVATAIHDGTAVHGYLNTFSGNSPVLEQIHSLPPLQLHLTYAPMYASNEALAHMPLGSIHTSLPNLRNQVGFNSRVDQLTERVDGQLESRP
ncbi:hypothetical protein ACE6H2_016289 [Prunus campanulata]